MNITNECNMELMARYEDNYFDLAIVDPPYGSAEDYLKLLDDPNKPVDDLNLRLPCLLVVDVKNPNLLFNPGFLQALEEYDEQESFYVTQNRIECDQIALVGVSEMTSKLGEYLERYNQELEAQPTHGWKRLALQKKKAKIEAIYKRLKQLHSKGS